MNDPPFRTRYTMAQGDSLHYLEDMRTARTGLGRALRWAMVGFGLMWVIGGSAQLEGGHTGYGLLGILLGAVVLYADWYIPYRQKHRMKQAPPQPLSVTLEATEEGLTASLGGDAPHWKPWATLSRVRNATYGAVLMFADGGSLWIPDRVWEGRRAKKAFVRRVKRYKRAQRRRPHRSHSVGAGRPGSEESHAPHTESDVHNREGW